MKTIGFCTHFSQTDDWALDYALDLARRQRWQLVICHWLDSPYNLRRDVVYASLGQKERLQTVTPRLLVELEQQLRQYYEPRLGDFTQVAFKLCEGMYQVELQRCLRQSLLQMVVMGYQQPGEPTISAEQTQQRFAWSLPFPVVMVGPERPNQFHLNRAAQEMLQDLQLSMQDWKSLEPALIGN